MASIVGRQIEVGVAKETTRGTAKTTADKWLKNVIATIIPKAEKVIDDATRGKFEDADQARLVRSWYEGEIEGIAQVDVLGYFFQNIYGSVSTATDTGSAKKHTFSVGQSPQNSSYTLFVKDGGVAQEVLSNGMIKSLSLKASTDDFVRFKAAFLAAVASANGASPTYGTEYDFIGRDITVKIADTSGGIAGASAIPVKSLEVTWDQGLIPSFVFGQYGPADINNSNLSIEGKLVLDLSDTTFRALLQADTPKYMNISIKGAAVIGGATSVPTIDLTLNKAQLMDWSRGGNSNELVQQEVSFKGFFNAADAKQSTLFLVNLTTAY